MPKIRAFSNKLRNGAWSEQKFTNLYLKALFVNFVVFSLTFEKLRLFDIIFLSLAKK